VEDCPDGDGIIGYRRHGTAGDRGINGVREKRLEGFAGLTLPELVDSVPDDFPKNSRTARRDPEVLEAVGDPLFSEWLNGQTSWRLVEGFSNIPAACGEKHGVYPAGEKTNGEAGDSGGIRLPTYPSRVTLHRTRSRSTPTHGALHGSRSALFFAIILFKPVHY
jgi:hypothetical protein